MHNITNGAMIHDIFTGFRFVPKKLLQKGIFISITILSPYLRFMVRFEIPKSSHLRDIPASQYCPVLPAGQIHRKPYGPGSGRQKPVPHRPGKTK